MWTVFAIYFVQDRGTIVFCDSSANETTAGWTGCQNCSSACVCGHNPQTHSRGISLKWDATVLAVFLSCKFIRVLNRTRTCREERRGIPTERWVQKGNENLTPQTEKLIFPALLITSQTEADIKVSETSGGNWTATSIQGQQLTNSTSNLNSPRSACGFFLH